jgi:type IV pilus assembly protein PilC
VKKFPESFNTLFISMVEAGEASGGLAEILGKVAGYFEVSVKLTKKVKSAMTYPIAVIGLAVALVNVLLIFVIPVFAAMFAAFGAKLPAPTQFLIDLSDFMKAWWWAIGIGAYATYWTIGKYTSTPKGRRHNDQFLVEAPIFGNLIHKIALSRFCRTYATLSRRQGAGGAGPRHRRLPNRLKVGLRLSSRLRRPGATSTFSPIYVHAQTHRPSVHPHHRRRPHRDRPGLRV